MPIDNFYKSIHHSAGKNSMCGIHKSTERHIVKEQHIKVCFPLFLTVFHHLIKDLVNQPSSHTLSII